MRVKDVMTREVASVRPETSLKEVATLLAERGVSGLPVVDEEGRVLGVVSESDFLLKERGQAVPPGHERARLYQHDPAELEAKLAARTAGEAMTSPAITTHPARSLAEAATLMVERGVNRLPVLEGGKLVGILARADLVRAFARPDEEIERELRDVLRTLRIPLERLSISVHSGEVTLAGEVETRSDAELLPHAARRVPGVVSVLSKLTWQAEDWAEPSRER